MSSAAANATPTSPLFNWLGTRAAGVLLHPTALPGDQGIGTFDEHAVRFLDFLQAAGLKYWQLCPLGPTGYGDSPYQSFSAFAGNPYLIDLKALVAAKFLTPAEIAPLAALNADRVDYGALYEKKWPLLAQAFARFKAAGAPALASDGETFAQFQTKQSAWLDGYAFFRALKDHHRGVAWWEWPAAVRSYLAAKKSPLRAQLATATGCAHLLLEN